MAWEYNQAVINMSLEILDKKFEGYEAILAKQHYVAGEVCLFLRCSRPHD
jgi:hypothetical protein